MGSSPMGTSKLLLNAEPFGFGPSAAIASFFPYLREHFSRIGFVGTGHTLDLQRNLPYDSIHDLTPLSDSERYKQTKKIMQGYDILLTATDFVFAQKGLDEGLEVIIYDPLTWYWKEIPEVIRSCHLYIAQDFYGVKERLKSEKGKFPNTVIVPPIIDDPKHSGDKKYWLINLGGLKNQFMQDSILTRYATIIVDGICERVRGEDIIISTSTEIAKALGPHARTYTREEMAEILSLAQYACMTPGLGNIFDCAYHNIPTIWLPPANDSQGQQLQILEREGLLDASLTWDKVLFKELDFFKNQEDALFSISDAIRIMTSNPHAARWLKICIQQEVETLQQKSKSSIARIIDQFGKGGSKDVGHAVISFAEERG